MGIRKRKTLGEEEKDIQMFSPKDGLNKYCRNTQSHFI